MRVLTKYGFGLGATYLLACSGALAQTAPQERGSTDAERSDQGLDVIVVTATKTGSTQLQSTPVAISAVTSEILNRTGVDDIRDLAQLTPNLQIAQNAAFSQVYIRGIGSNNVFAGSDPSSTIHVDGVYIARPAAGLSNFLDVERVEVLRGPQGTLYGRNSVGGTINIISKQPGNQFQAKGQLTVGNYGLMRGELYASGPLVDDKVAASVSVSRSYREGYIENIAIPGNRVDDEDVTSGRAQIRIQPSDRFNVTFRADYSYADESLAGNIKLLAPSPDDPLVNTVLGDYRKVALNRESRTERELWGFAADAKFEISPMMTLSSLTAYRGSTIDSANDTDATSKEIRLTTQFEDQTQFSQEFNISGSSDTISYIAGLYYFDEKIEADAGVTNFVPGLRIRPNPLVHTKAWAGYGQATYYIASGLGLTAGIRYTEEDKDFSQRFSIVTLSTGAFRPGYPLTYQTDDSYKAWTPRFGIEYQAADDLFLFASATKGFKSGGFNFASQNPNQGYAPETLWSYEAGLKSEFLENRIRFNATGFWYDYSELQVQSFITPGVVDITNAADARVRGLELELLAKPTRGLSLGGNLAYLDAKYRNYTNALLPGNIPFDASGNRLNSAPEWAYNIYGQYDHELDNSGTLYVRGEYNWKSRQYYSAQNNNVESQPSFGLVNASLGYNAPDERWSVMAFGRNLANKEYVTTTATFTGPVSGRVGEPRTYGLRLAFNY